MKCVQCGSTDLRFVDFDRVLKREDEKKISVMELWACSVCGNEVGRLGKLFSPQDMTRTKIRITLLTWGGYVGGTLLAHALYFGSL